MDDRRAQIQQNIFLIHCMTLILMLSVAATVAKRCPNRLDIVIAVDTTSSRTASDFESVKTEVKAIGSSFIGGQSNTRLALVSISQHARVVVNFSEMNSWVDRLTFSTNSLEKFNSAVDSLTFSTDPADLAKGIKVSKDSVLSAVRSKKTSKILILVKDRRYGNAAVTDNAMLSSMSSEAYYLKSLGAVIHAVGIGGLWNSLELDHLFGTDHILFKDKNKAAESAKSLNNLVCDANCKKQGTSTKQDGLCYELVKHVIGTSVTLTTNSVGDSICRKYIHRNLEHCSGRQSCHTMDRKVGACGSDGKVTIELTWKSFDTKLQRCVGTVTATKVDCRDANTCPGQVADVIFVIDKSTSHGGDFTKMKQIAKPLMESLNIGKDNVRIGVIPYDHLAHCDLRFGSILDKAALLRKFESFLPSYGYGPYAYTASALGEAWRTFDNFGRANVPKFVFLITHSGNQHSTSDSSWPDEELLFQTATTLKNEGITVYALGSNDAKEEDLRRITTPESDTNMIHATDLNQLQTMSQELSKRLCFQMSSPHPKLCDDKIALQSISACVGGEQHVTKTEYKYNGAGKCIKTTHSTVHTPCRPKCTSPIDGKEYIEGESWTDLCYDFQCSGNAKPVVTKWSKCPAADGSCKAINSPPFTCLDEQLVEVANCQCIGLQGIPTLLIETE